MNDVYAVVGEKAAIEWSDEEPKGIDRFTRYKTTAERSYERVWRRLDTMRKDRAREMDQQWKPKITPARELFQGQRHVKKRRGE